MLGGRFLHPQGAALVPLQQRRQERLGQRVAIQPDSRPGQPDGPLGVAARPAGSALVAALQDPDPTVRGVVARALEKLAPEVPGAVPALIERFPEVDAVRAVARFRDPAAVPPLTALLSHPDPTIRRNAAYKPIKVVMMTSLIDEDSVRRAYEAGANGYIKKPFTTRDLHAELNSQLGNKAAPPAGIVL